MKVYVGNMSFNTTEDALRQAFEAFGEVVSVNIITDRDTGRPRGFGFVEMSNEDEGNAAIAGLNGQEVDGRTLNVNVARQRENNNRGGSGGGGGGGGYRKKSW
jgi:cold-inducible RNA-binding protein